MGHFNDDAMKAYRIIMLVLALIALLLAPIFKGKDFDNKKKSCTYETQAYVSDLKVKKQTNYSSRRGYRRTKVEYYNEMICEYEYNGQQYNTYTNFKTSRPIEGPNRYTTIYVDPDNPVNILTADEENLIKNSADNSKKIVMAAVFIIVIVIGWQIVASSKKKY